MRVLVLCDDFYHPARTPRAGLAPLANSGVELDWIEHASEWSAERMADYRLVLLTKSNHVSAADQTPWMSAQVEAAFQEYVRRGNGLLVIHSGSAGYTEQTTLRNLIGGIFDHHPAQCPVTITPRADHPLCAGITPFEVFDEHYFMDMSDPRADVFLSTVSEHGTQPGGWTRTDGDGRVCVLTPGHNLDVWLHPSYQALIGNALRWCDRSADR